MDGDNYSRGMASDEQMGPRTVVIQRGESTDFGFTLRHFIVYPPQINQPVERGLAATNEGRRVGDGAEEVNKGGSELDPMDTIFVKYVVPEGPAARAGLRDGDRIISVNGDCTVGKSYGQVLALVRASDSVLKLVVVPKHEDVIQMAYNTAVYNDVSIVYRSESAADQPPPSPRQTVLGGENKRVSPTGSSHLHRVDGFSRHHRLQADVDRRAGGREPVSLPTIGSLLYDDRRSLVGGNRTALDRLPGRESYGPAYYITKSPSPSITSSQASRPQSLLTSGAQQTVSQDECHITGSLQSPSADSASNVFVDNRKSSPRYERRSRTELVSPSSSALTTGEKATTSDRGSADNLSETSSSLSGRSLRGVDLAHSWTSGASSRSNAIKRSNHDDASSVISVESKQSIDSLTSSAVGGSQHLSHRSAVGSLYNGYSIISTESVHPSSFSRGNSCDSATQQFSTRQHSNNELDFDSGITARRGSSSSRIETPLAECVAGARVNESWPQRTEQAKLTDSSSVLSKRLASSSPLAARYIAGKVTLDTSESLKTDGVVKRYSVESPTDTSAREKRYNNRHSRIVDDGAYVPKSSSPTSTLIKLGSDAMMKAESGGVPQALPPPELEKVAIITPVALPATSLSFGAVSGLEHTSSSVRIEPSPRLQYNKQPIVTQHTVTQSLSSAIGSVPSFESFPVSRSEWRAQQGTSVRVVGSTASSDSVRLLDTSDRVIVTAFPSGRDELPGRYLGNEGKNKVRQEVSTGRNTPPSPPSPSPPRMHSRHAFLSRHDQQETETINVAHNSSYVKTSTDSSVRPKSHIEDMQRVPEKSILAVDVRPMSYIEAGRRARGRHDNHVPLTSAAHTPPNGKVPTGGDQANMKKLKDFFGEQTPQLKQALDERHQPVDSSGSPVLTRRNRAEAGLHWPDSSQEASSTDLDLSATLEGPLMCKFTVADGKRVSDRSWRQLWVEVKGQQLFLYKEKRGQLEDPPLSLSSCLVDIAYDYTKRKNVFRLTTSCGEYYFQANDQLTMFNWIRVLQEHSQLASGKEELTALQLNRGGHEPKAINNTSKNKPIMRSKSGTRKQASGQPDKDTADSVAQPKEKTWRGRVARRFRRSLSTSGAVAGTDADANMTFGVPLDQCPASGMSEYIPFVVELCVKIVEQLGMTHVGVYRIPGNAAAISMLKDELNKGADIMDLDNDKWSDINVVGSLLKHFFQKLHEPLITEALYGPAIAASRIDDSAKRLTELKHVVHKLPRCNFETLAYLCKHLHRIALHEDINKMGARNLAVVFGPTLIYTKDESVMSMVKDMSDQCRIVESLILHPDWFFSQTVRAAPVDSVAAAIPLTSNTDALLNSARGEPVSGHNAAGVVSSLVNAAKKTGKKSDTDKRDDDIKRVGEGQHKALEKTRSSQPLHSTTASHQVAEPVYQVNHYPAYIKYREDGYENRVQQDVYMEAGRGQRGRPLYRGSNEHQDSDDEVLVKPAAGASVTPGGRAERLLQNWERRYDLQRTTRQVTTRQHVNVELQRAQRDLEAGRRTQNSSHELRSGYRNQYAPNKNVALSQGSLLAQPRSQRDIAAEARRNFLTNPSIAVAITPPHKDSHVPVENRNRVHIDSGHGRDNVDGRATTATSSWTTQSSLGDIPRSNSLDSMCVPHASKAAGKIHSSSPDDDDFASSLTSAFDARLEQTHSPGSLLDRLSASTGLMNMPVGSQVPERKFSLEYLNPSLHRTGIRQPSRAGAHVSEAVLSKPNDERRHRLGSALSASCESIPRAGNGFLDSDLSPSFSKSQSTAQKMKQRLLADVQQTRRRTVEIGKGNGDIPGGKQVPSAWERLQPLVTSGGARDLSSWLAHMRLRKKTRSVPNLRDEGDDTEDSDGESGMGEAGEHADGTTVAGRMHGYAELQKAAQSRVSHASNTSPLRNFTYESSI